MKSGRHGLFLTALLIAEVSSAFEVSMIYAGLPTLRRVFGDPIGVGWVITSCFLVSAMAAALCGRLGDLLGRRLMLLICLSACGFGSLISAFSSTLSGLILGASVQGVAGAILPLCFGLAREALPQPRVPLAIGTIVAAAALGSGGGLMLGGAIVDRFSWNAIFFTSGSMAFFGALCVWLFVPSSVRQTAARKGIDMVRGVLFAPAIGGILFAVGKAKEWGWTDQRVLAIVAGSALLLAWWARHQLRQENPLINLRLFAERRVAIGYTCMALIALGTMQVAQIMSLFLQQPAWTLVGFGLTATAAGAFLLPSQLVGLVASPLSGKVAEHRGARIALLLGAAMVSIAWASIAMAHTNLWFVVCAIVLSAFGFSTVYAAIPNLIVEAVPPERTSEATGISSVIRATFMAVGAQMVSVLLASSTIDDPARATVKYSTDAAFTLGFVYIAAASILCLLLAWFLPKRTVALSAVAPAVAVRAGSVASLPQSAAATKTR